MWLLFEWPPELFEWPSLVCWHNQLNFLRCLSKVIWYLHSLTLFMKSLHSLNKLLLIWPVSSFIHASLKHVVYGSYTFICQLFLSSLRFSSPQGVLMLLFNLRLLGVIFWLIHLRVNLLWLLKLAIFFSRCSYHLRMELDHMTYIDQSWSFKITTGHVTLQGKHNWPIGSSAILHNTFSLLWNHQMTSHLYRCLYKQGQLGGTVIDTLSTAVSGSLCCFIISEWQHFPCQTQFQL